MPARNTSTLRKPEVGDSTHLPIDIVKNHIETCLKKDMNMAETVQHMWRVHSTPPRVTSILWRRLQEQNVEAFRPNSPSRPAESMNSQNLTSGDPQAPRCLPTPEAGSFIYPQIVRNNIERCLKKYMNLEETKAFLWREARIPPPVTSMVWEKLQEQNGEFFRDYSRRLAILQQIKTFNMLLSRQAELMNRQNLTNHHDYPQPTRSDQNSQSFSYDQLPESIEMSSTAPNSPIESPQDSDPVPSDQPVGAPDSIVSAEYSWPEYILPESGQNQE